MNRIPLVSACLLLSFGAMADQTISGAALQDSGQAIQHSGASAAHAIAASGRVTLGVSAVPLAIGGASLSTVGAISAGMAQDSARAASTPRAIGQPLEITNETITITPPDEALRRKPTAVQP